MRTVLRNKFLTTKDGKRYEVGKYMVSDGSRKGESYYVTGFFFHSVPEGQVYVHLDGRFKGDRQKTPLTLASRKRIRERLILSRADADRFREQAGRGKKPRFVGTSGGYIYLPDVLMFDEPLEIMGWAADNTIKWCHELHKRKPAKRFFRDWIAEENGYGVED